MANWVASFWPPEPGGLRPHSLWHGVHHDHPPHHRAACPRLCGHRHQDSRPEGRQFAGTCSNNNPLLDNEDGSCSIRGPAGAPLPEGRIARRRLDRGRTRGRPHRTLLSIIGHRRPHPNPDRPRGLFCPKDHERRGQRISSRSRRQHRRTQQAMLCRPARGRVNGVAEGRPSRS